MFNDLGFNIVFNEDYRKRWSTRDDGLIHDIVEFLHSEKSCEEENKRLKERIRELEAEIETLKQQKDPQESWTRKIIYVR